MSISHIIIFLIIAVIVIPPEKLPEVARQVARFFNDIRRSTNGLWDDIKKDAAFRPDDLLKPPRSAPRPQAAPTEPATTEAPPTVEETKKHES